MLKNIANIFGWVLLVAGIVDANAVYDVMYIITGLAGLYVAKKGEVEAQLFFKVIGIMYGLIALLGFITNNTANVWMHVAIAVIALYLGFGSKAEGSMQTA